MNPSITDWIGAITGAIGAITAIVGVWVAYVQIKGLRTSLLMNGLSAVLQIENDMHSRMARMNDISTRVEIENAKAKPNQKTLAALRRHEKACIEQYINAADRLAFCINNGYVPDQDWRPEYREFLSNIVKDHESFFGPNSIYTNIIDLNNKWKRV